MALETGVTRRLAQYLVQTRPDDLPGAVRARGVDSFVNWLGCAVGGSGHPAVKIALSALAPFAGAPQAAVLGRIERTDILTAALLNGVSSHVFDFDDTHLKTVIHPAGPVASAIMALAEYRAIGGAEFIHALILGIETECRIGNAVYPDHYAVGWHITGSAGVFGAAAAAGKVLGLNETQMTWALGIAASQPVGLREMFGTMTKSFHPGRAAQNGLTAALLAARDYTSSEQAIEAKRGWANVVSTRQDYREITDGLGERHESLLNTFKPFACGIVIHPVIDGCIQLRHEHHLDADLIDAVRLRVHPLVLELTGKRMPQTGLDGKFSVYHSAAVALIQGRAGEAQYSDAAVHHAPTVALRNKISAEIDPSLPADAAHIVLVLQNGQHLEKHIEHAIGSTANPMNREAIDGKFTDLTAPVLGAEQAAKLLWACREVESCGNMADLARLTQPEGKRTRC
ncbi:MmgE/PrpD family protein [Martelella alba]|uniref:MmgE/PrpD family protein n=2 Tax=Martelella alba TaxID=2590451 RepID=A0ABY2SGV8_9HYPH|nr:MmgE/PrpD family protein [Martelella alba]